MPPIIWPVDRLVMLAKPELNLMRAWLESGSATESSPMMPPLVTVPDRSNKIDMKSPTGV